MCLGEELLGSVSSEDIVKRFSKEAVTKSTRTSSGSHSLHSLTSSEGRLSFQEPCWWVNSATMWQLAFNLIPWRLTLLRVYAFITDHFQILFCEVIHSCLDPLYHINV